MSLRQVIGLLALGGVAYALWKRGGVNLPGTLVTPPTGPLGPSGGPSSLTDDFDRVIARIESGGQLLAKNPRSSASGKYQFTRDTWLRLGGSWGPDPTKAFGGLTPSEAEQDARFKAFKAGNASGLVNAGITATSGALYAAHFLGLAGAVRVLSAAPSTKLAALVGSKVMAANPQLEGFTVSDFRSWTSRQVAAG